MDIIIAERGRKTKLNEKPSVVGKIKITKTLFPFPFLFQKKKKNCQKKKLFKKIHTHTLPTDDVITHKG